MAGTTASSFDSQEGEEVCPICLLGPSLDRPFCIAPCSHRFCVPDLERILAGGLRIMGRDYNPDPHSGLIPTLGRCPICRKELSLFDLKKDTSHQEGDGNKYCLYARNDDMTTWSIANKDYEEQNGNIKFTFNVDEGPKFYWFRQDEEHECFFQRETCHFHEQSRTFHGRMEFPVDQPRWKDNVSSLDCVFQFSSDLRFIAAGAFINEGGIADYFGVGGRMVHATSLSAQARERPTYHGEGLWGNTFCQIFRVGMASYHFVSPQESYISYEHPLTSQWPPLDDGSPVPARVPFHNVTLQERTFHGEICWHQDYGTTWQGCRRWVYDINFDSRFTFVVSGSVRAILADSEESHEMSVFGRDLMYMNAAIETRFRQVVREIGGNNTAMQSHFQQLSQQLRQEWAQQQASVRTIAMLHSALTNVTIGQEPVDFNTS